MLSPTCASARLRDWRLVSGVSETRVAVGGPVKTMLLRTYAGGIFLSCLTTWSCFRFNPARQ